MFRFQVTRGRQGPRRCLCLLSRDDDDNDDDDCRLQSSPCTEDVVLPPGDDDRRRSSTRSRRRRADAVPSRRCSRPAAGEGAASSPACLSKNYDAKRGDVENAAEGVVASNGPTNEVVKSVNGMRQRRLGGSDIIVSELGLGTQRW